MFASVDWQKMPERLILNFGPRTLSRVHCETCKEETLHVRDVCNHCTPRPNSAGAVGVRTRMRRAESGRVLGTTKTNKATSSPIMIPSAQIVPLVCPLTRGTTG